MPLERLERLKNSDGQLHSQWTAPWIEKRLAQRKALDPDYRLDTMANDFNARSGEISKLLIIVHAPFLAFALMLMFWRRGKYFAEHFVVALITFSSVLLAIQITFPFFTIFPLGEWLTDQMMEIVRWIMAAVLTGLLAATFKRAYKYSYWYSALSALSFSFFSCADQRDCLSWHTVRDYFHDDLSEDNSLRNGSKTKLTIRANRLKSQ